jgi:Ti-type conjugative transfer relaxase TraA
MDASRHVSRGAGQSAVAAAAYRSGERLYDERAAEVHDYTGRYGVAATGIVMPERGGPSAGGRAWTREELWNAAEVAERRKDSRTARKIEMALPAAMTTEQRREVAVAWAGEIANRYGVAVDWAIHLPDRDGDQRNHHVHLMMTTREVGPEGFRGKAALELSNTDQKARGLPVGDDAIYALREALAERLNAVAERHGLELHADPRSYAERGIDLTPTKHIGVHAVAMDRRGMEAERAEDHAAVRQANAERIVARPELVLETLTQREAVFTRQDMARELHRHIDDAGQFQTVLARLEASPELVRLSEGEGRDVPRFSTREMVAAEGRMMAAAGALAAAPTHGVSEAHLAAAQARHAGLSEEQREAVAHITAPGQLAAVAGAAGSGKSASLAAAREAWEAEGYRVRGAALAGKAADALQASAGIESRTLHSLEYGWRNGRDGLGSRDVLVIDEAGMVGSRQMGRVLEAAEQAGAKVVLVGDARQLQPIEAGAAFRAVAEQIGVAEIEAIRRQREPWAREASQAFAQGAVADGLAAYAERGHVQFSESREAAKAAMARDAVAAGIGDGASLILAHTNQDVQDLNALVRAERQRGGELAGETSFQTARGARDFAAGDRVVFLQNDRDLGVKNGTLATVERTENNSLTIRLDGASGEGTPRTVRVDQAAYAHIDHGYAVTLHKAQGATVDRTFVLASGGMDRHLAYVGMTRHRDSATLYAGHDDFRDEGALARRLSRARPKESTLDFAERRGFETEKPWLENARAWVERGRERLGAAWERAEQMAAAVRDRFRIAEVSPVQETTPDAQQQKLRETFRAAEQAPAQPTAEAARIAALRDRFRTAEPAREADPDARRQKLRETFRSAAEVPAEPTAEAARIAALRDRFRAAEPGQAAGSDAARSAEARSAGAQSAEARREALRAAFAKEGQAPPRTPEQIRQAMQERDKPPAERRAGKESGQHRGQDKGHERER